MRREAIIATQREREVRTLFYRISNVNEFCCCFTKELSMRERKLSSNNFVSDVCRLARQSECLFWGVHRVKSLEKLEIGRTIRVKS